jgi:hypothetical protein
VKALHLMETCRTLRSLHAFDGFEYTPSRSVQDVVQCFLDVRLCVAFDHNGRAVPVRVFLSDGGIVLHITSSYTINHALAMMVGWFVEDTEKKMEVEDAPANGSTNA